MLLADPLIASIQRKKQCRITPICHPSLRVIRAPATFQRLMDNILRPHAAYAASYLDDIIIYSNECRTRNSVRLDMWRYSIRAST